MRRPPHRRSAIVIVAGLCLFAAVIGFWLVQSERAVSVLPQPVLTSVGALHSGRAHLDNGSSPTAHQVLTTAGQQRHRLPAPSHSVPSSWWSPMPDSPDSLPIVWYRLGGTYLPTSATARAPATVLAGHDLLTRLCVDRR